MKYVLLLVALICVTQSVRAQSGCDPSDYFKVITDNSDLDQIGARIKANLCFDEYESYREAVENEKHGQALVKRKFQPPR